LEGITILREAGEETDKPISTLMASVMTSFKTIFGDKLRNSTLKILASYSCLQILYKGLLYVLTTMFRKNFCGLHVGGSKSEDVNPHCATLSNGDLISGIILSTVFYPSTVVSVYLTEKIGDNAALKIFALLSLIFNIIMLICMPVPLAYVNLGLLCFSIAAMSLVFYMILPQMYPTVARNSGFGLVDGVGKLVASVGIFVITAALTSSMRGAIGILIVICFLINVQVFCLKMKRDSSLADEFKEHEDILNGILPHVD
jgi:hypothetical protein